MKPLIILPCCGEESFKIAADIFCDMYTRISGISPDVSKTDDGVSDLVIIGNDSVNAWLAEKMMSGKIKSLGIRYGTDDYCIRTTTENGRNILILAGGRGRSEIYSIYDFFERQAGCHYFWDGDIIPKNPELTFGDWDVTESPRFEYRGLRYFAHRGLKRFQAEHWSYEDWTKEIDWMLKKRLNFFMLRIGMDDIWQRAFPDIVPYSDIPQTDNPGYDDRTQSWSTKFRGELRIKLLKYAISRDLMHPEDCGTMTHWYSPTPKEYMDAVNPKTQIQADCQYTQSNTTLVWDIFDQENVDNYMKLTETAVKEYNPGANIFHTIGVAERNIYADREPNHRFKLYAYRKISQSLREKFPNSKLMLASWDFIGWWTSDEVQNLTNELDPERTIILDYTSDADDENETFVNWGVLNKFPWIFGLFHAYEPESSLRGVYERSAERLKKAVDDPFCKGMILWPELSHSDPIVLEYLCEKSWNPDNPDVSETLLNFCCKRYGEKSDTMHRIWKTFFPVITLADWGGYTRRADEDKDSEKYTMFWNVHRETWFNAPETIHGVLENQQLRKHINYKIGLAIPPIDNAVSALEKICQFPDDYFENDFILRDITDIARTAVGRYMNYLILKAALLHKNPDAVNKIQKIFNELMLILPDILAFNDDFSMYKTLKSLEDAHPVSSDYETTLKKNLVNNYCRQYAYEPVKYLFVHECNSVFQWLTVPENKRDKNELKKSCEIYLSDFMKTPLYDMQPKKPVSIKDCIKKSADLLKEVPELLNIQE